MGNLLTCSRRKLAHPALVLLLLAAFAGAASAAEAPVPRDPVSLKLLPQLSMVEPSAEAVLVERWLSLLDSSDPASQRSAFELLEGARTTLMNRARQELRAPGRDLSGLANANWLLNTPVLQNAKLMDPFEPDLTALLEIMVSAAKTPESRSALIVPIMSLRGLTRLSPRLARQVIELAKDGSELGVEARSVLLDLPFPADELTPVLQAWAGDPAAPVTAKTLVPWTLLLRSKAEIPEARWIDLLRGDGMSEAIAALRRRPGLLQQSPALREAVREKLLEPPPVTAWFELFTLTREQMPDFAEQFYEARRQVPGAAWTLPIDAVFLALADRKHDQWISALPAPAPSPDCAGIRWRLAVLERKARTGQPVAQSLSELWREAADCRPDAFIAGPTDAELWDRVVAAASEDKQPLEGLLLPLLTGSTTSWPIPVARSARIAALHETALVDALVNGQTARADYLLKIGATPDGRKLAERGYWKGFDSTDPKPLSRVDLAALQRTRAVPEAVWQRIETVAADETGDFEQRAWALAALASSGRGPRVRKQLAERLNDQDANLVRIASTLLAETLDHLPSNAQLPPISWEVLDNFRLRPELTDQAKAFHQRLLRFSPDFVESFIDHSSSLGEPCLVLAARIPAPAKVTRKLLIDAASNEAATATNQRLCIRLIGDAKDPSVILARTWEKSEKEQAVAIAAALRRFWEDEDARAALKSELATRAARIASLLPGTLESQSEMKYWERQLSASHPQEARQIASERRKRTAYAALLGIPLALLVHLGAWFLILTIYPRSSAIQSIVLWNPWFRRILGLGYFDLVLLAWPFARRQLFSPFREHLLGDVLERGETEFDRRDYFAESLVRRRREGGGDAEQAVPILTTLPQERGRVLLIGRSGLGKSSFLRFLLTRTAIQAREVAAYLRADHCKGGVEAAIVARCMELGNDQQLIRAMIHAGRLFVYIDGYNEVDSSTQDQITLFLSNFPRANIMVASQIPLRGLTRLQTFEIQPLDHTASRAFLLSRVNVLPEDSRVTAEAYTRSGTAFLDDYWTRRQAGTLTETLDEAMANPMDLTTVALLLAQARVPDLYSLEWQHFELARQRLMANGSMFRIEPFSKAVLVQRLADREDLEQLDFKPEVAALIESKLAQIRTYADRSGRIVTQEARFRHERVRDFFCHFAMAAVPPDEMAQLARDARLAGVFPFLARSLPAEHAATLREHLIRMAAEVEDHRVSDAYVRELLRREQMQGADPDWLDEFDSATAFQARRRASELLGERSAIDKELAASRQAIDRSRRATRILALASPDQLLDRARELLESFGARPEGKGNTDMMCTPAGARFGLAAAASAFLLQPYQLELALARTNHSGFPVLLVVNSEADREPASRQPLAFSPLLSGVILLHAQELLALCSPEHVVARDVLWQRIENTFPEEGSHD